MQLHDTKCKKNGKIIHSPRSTFIVISTELITDTKKNPV